MNMNKCKEKMPQREPDARSKTFDEVATGYTEKKAVSEADRCLQCKHAPCIEGCPVNVKIPEFIKLIKEGLFEEGYKKILEDNLLPAICGRVCPQEKQCESRCVRGLKGDPVGIGYLERFAADQHFEKAACENIEGDAAKRETVVPKGKIAIIGSGPAGLSCAADLAKFGYDVTVFEAFHKLGGVLVYGIPEFRLPKGLVEKEIENLKNMGVKFVRNFIVGRTATIDQLKEEGFKAFFIGTGAGLPSFMGIPGENYNGVYTSNEFLTRINLMKGYLFPEYDTPVNVGKTVAVVGGGNVAMDAARCAKRLGAESVHIIYRRSTEEMPARIEEVHHAVEEGIIFDTLTNPTRILGDENGVVTGIECVRMELGEPDSSGRRRPLKIDNTEFAMKVDNVIIAVGQSPNPLVGRSVSGLEINGRGCISAEEDTGRTTVDGIYAGGDAVTGAATVILAMGAGKKAAADIDKYLRGIV